MNQQLCLLVASALQLASAQVQYFENNTLIVPIWHLFKTRKPEWANWSAPATEENLNWIEWHTRASIMDVDWLGRSSTKGRSHKKPPRGLGVETKGSIGVLSFTNIRSHVMCEPTN
jgi:hypothetical protein